MNKKVSLVVRGEGKCPPLGKWCCRLCNRDFKLPRIPDTCEVIYSICMTCYVSSSVNVVELEKRNSR